MTRPRIAGIVFTALAAIAVAYYLSQSRQWGVEKFGELTQVLAFLGAALFFGYQAITGFFITNASVRLEAVRSRKSKDVDFLAIRLSLAKGDRGTLVVHDARLRVRQGSAQPLEPCLDAVKRLSYVRSILPSAKRPISQVSPIWDRQSEKAPFLHLSPGESAEFGAHCEVASDSPCLIEAVVVGPKPTFGPVGQWRASAVSLPVTKPDRDPPAV